MSLNEFSLLTPIFSAVEINEIYSIGTTCCCAGYVLAGVALGVYFYTDACTLVFEKLATYELF